MSPIVFSVLAVLLIACGLGVVLARSPIRSALSLVMALFFLAVMFLLLDAQLVAALQVIVYAGAVVVLFLFVIMLLNLQHEPGAIARTGVRYGGLLLGSLFLLALIRFLAGDVPLQAGPGMEGAVDASFGSTALLAERLFTQHLLAFEITSLLLLVAIVSAVVLAKKKLA
jgi:NADH-quinone oxidoreductase subunit J